MYGYAVRWSITSRLGGFEEVEGHNAGVEGGIGGSERVHPFGIPFCVSSEAEVFGTGVSGFRPPGLPFGCAGWMVAVDELGGEGMFKSLAWPQRCRSSGVCRIGGRGTAGTGRIG